LGLAIGAATLSRVLITPAKFRYVVDVIPAALSVMVSAALVEAATMCQGSGRDGERAQKSDGRVSHGTSQVRAPSGCQHTAPTFSEQKIASAEPHKMVRRYARLMNDYLWEHIEQLSRPRVVGGASDKFAAVLSR
jgi:hypothetical protein